MKTILYEREEENRENIRAVVQVLLFSDKVRGPEGVAFSRRVEMPTKNIILYPGETVEKKALEAYLEMVQANPKNPALYYEMGWFYEQSGAYEHAIDQWLETIQFEPGNLVAREAILAVLMKRKGLSAVEGECNLARSQGRGIQIEDELIPRIALPTRVDLRRFRLYSCDCLTLQPARHDNK